MASLIRCSLLIALTVAPSAHANLTVHPMRTSVDASRGTTIRVHSQSAQPQFVQVSLRRIVEPADADEHEVEIEASAAAFALTPAKFALAGGSNRLVRLIPLQPVQQETAYRVYFEGVRAPEEGEVIALDEQTSANVGVSLVWGALVNVLPDDGQVGLSLRGTTLHNTGTLRVGITRVADCNANGRCESREIARSLYPGASLQLPVNVQDGHTLQLHYRLTRDGYREHLHKLVPDVPSVTAPAVAPAAAGLSAAAAPLRSRIEGTP